jgi:plasmid stability protein
MAAITVRNLPDEIHRALKARAKARGRSTEAEVRAILIDTTAPVFEVRLGSLLADIGREAQEAGPGPELEIERDRTATDPIDFE